MEKENNKMKGKGKLIWPDGRFYEGDFKNNNKNGDGYFIWPLKNEEGKFHSYRGKWLNGKQHGMGIYTDIKGNEKTGIW